MAVAPSEQRKGIGKLLFRSALAILQEKVGEPAGLLLEVQNEKHARDEKDRAIRRGRLLFYKKLGAKMVTEHYLLPPQSGSDPEETYLLMMPHAIEHIPGDSLLKLIKAVYLRVYGYEADDLLLAMARKLPARCQLSDIP